MPNGGVREYRSEGTFGVISRAHKEASHTHRHIHYRGIGTRKIHRLVCEAFHGPAPSKKSVVMHLNEDAHDNRPENLKWGTQKENLNMPLAKERFRARVGDKNPRNIHRDRREDMRWLELEF
jgi:hypothetical protein